ncbi:MAG: haloacid dehalogenase type II [Deltaproteobacteria bacterium]
MATVRAVVFDAYGTLLDFATASERAGDVLGERWRAFSDLWRRKQLEYTWLRSLMRRHVDFWQVTGESLDYALQAFAIRDPELRGRLMNLYLHLEAYPDVRPTLEALRADGLQLAVLSNGSSGMLDAGIRNARLDELLDIVLSVDEVAVYKPAPEVYAMAARQLDILPGEIGFVSANGWDAHGASAFGFRVAWCNRTGAPPDRLPGAPETEIRSLSEVPDFFAR